MLHLITTYDFGYQYPLSGGLAKNEIPHDHSGYTAYLLLGTAGEEKNGAKEAARGWILSPFLFILLVSTLL